MPTLTLYHRVGCHLCDDMRAALAEFRMEMGFDIQEIDVDAMPELATRYGILVPVLMLGEREICHYFLDLNALRNSLIQ